MIVDLEALEREARGAGEAFRTLRANDGVVLGLAARTAPGGLSYELEGQVRLLPFRSPFDPDELLARAGSLKALRDLGYSLFHYDDGWVVVSRPVLAGDLETEIGLVLRILALRPF